MEPTKSLISDNEKIELLKNVVVPKKYYGRIDVGVSQLNEMFGGMEMPGVLPGSDYLVTGVPGGGKSTLSLQLADLFAEKGKNVLYNIGEENRYMIKMRADRLNLSGKFAISQYKNVDELLEMATDLGVEILFQDSLQMLVGDIRENVEKIHFWKENSDAVVFLIGHSTKGGQFAGPNKIKHDVDGHIHLTLEPSGNRVLQFEKNRFGPAAIPYEFALTAAGLDFQQMKVADGDDEDEPEKGKREDRRDKILSLAKEKLLEGEKLSGYCFERLGLDCSGGFWRGMLARACRELSNEGNKIVESKVDGRTHFFIETAGA